MYRPANAQPVMVLAVKVLLLLVLLLLLQRTLLVAAWCW